LLGLCHHPGSQYEVVFQTVLLKLRRESYFLEFIHGAWRILFADNLVSSLDERLSIIRNPQPALPNKGAIQVTPLPARVAQIIVWTNRAVEIRKLIESD
jgi:hypothetical protein